MIAGLQELESLNLAGTKISDAGLVKLGKLSKLRELNLSNTQISKRGLESLVALPNLEKLYLYKTPKLDAQEVLAKFPKLKFVDSEAKP